MSRPERRGPGGDEPVFAEPWQAQAFALVLKLHEAGHFTWPEWAEALAAEIATAGPQDDGSAYYDHWLAALERLATRRGLVTFGEVAARKSAWAAAYSRTPHGQPVVLDPESLADRD